MIRSLSRPMQRHLTIKGTSTKTPSPNVFCRNPPHVYVHRDLSRQPWISDDEVLAHNLCLDATVFMSAPSRVEEVLFPTLNFGV